jgi:hypothetical protein
VHEYLLDEALAMRLRVEQANVTKPRARNGMAYESAADIPITGPVAPGPAAHLVRAE